MQTIDIIELKIHLLSNKTQNLRLIETDIKASIVSSPILCVLVLDTSDNVFRDLQNLSCRFYL